MSIKVNRDYHLNSYDVQNIDDVERTQVFQMVKGTAIYRLSNVIVDSTDNIIISAFFGLTLVGLLSNYQLITGGLASMCRILFVALAPSVGNLNVLENKSKKEEIFNVINFVSFFIYTVFSLCLLLLINPFITLWIGKEYLLNYSTALALSINFFITGLNQVLWIYRTTMGLHRYNQFRPILSIIFNIILSIIMGKWLGVAGVIYATAISKLTTTMVFDPIIIYKYGFNKSPKGYFLKNLIYILCFSLTLLVIIQFGKFIMINTMFKWILIGFIVFGGLSILYLLLFSKTKEVRYLLNVAKNFYLKLTNKK